MWLQVAEVGKCRRNALDEVLFALDKSTESVRAERLQHADEQDEVKLFGKLGSVNDNVLRERIDIIVIELVTLGAGQSGTRLVQQCGEVVLQRTVHPALKVDIRQLAVVYHNIARLKIAVHEVRLAGVLQILSQLVAVGFEQVFVLEGGIPAWQAADLPLVKGRA